LNKKKYVCQTALIKIIDDWKKALDDNKFIAAILIDLSKAFDCLPYNLLLLKLEAYGLSKNSLTLVQSDYKIGICCFSSFDQV
jgi:hypothetical protein